MNISQVKLLLRSGLSLDAFIVYSRLDGGWSLSFQGDDLLLDNHLTTFKGDLRVFSNLSTAVGVAHSIGFTKVQVNTVGGSF